MIYDLRDKVAIVTGATGKHGIGSATALRLASDGANVVVVDIHRTHPRSAELDKQEGWKGLDSVVEEIQALGQQSLAVIADITKSDQVQGIGER